MYYRINVEEITATVKDTLDLFYAEGIPLILAAWFASHYNEEETKNVLKTIQQSFHQFGEVRMRQKNRRIKIIRTKKEMFILLNKLKKRKDWKNLPPYLYKQMLDTLT